MQPPWRKSSSILLWMMLTLSGAARANVIGSDAQNFNPTTSGLDFVTVQSGRTLDPGTLNMGLFFNYAINTLSFLQDADPGAVQNRTRLNDKLLSMDLNIGYGISQNWDIGLSLPFLVSQTIDNSTQVAYFANSGGFTEARANAKYRFYQGEDSAWATIFSINKNLIVNDPYAGVNAGPTLNAELAYSKKLGEFWVGLNAGHRWRNRGESLASTFGFDPLPNQWIYSAAVSRRISSADTKLIGEIFGSSPSEQTQDLNLSNRERSNLEALLGVKHDYSENLALHAGAGSGLQKGFATPDYRIYVGLNWTSSPPRVSQPEGNLKVYVLSNLKFKFDSDVLTEYSQGQVNKVITSIQGIRDIIDIRVEGHTDSMGPDEYNLQLSRRRALAIKKVLAEKIPFDSAKITSEGYGKTQPIADNDNYQGRAQNRRVVITVHSKELGSKQMTR